MSYDRSITARYNAALDSVHTADALANSMRGPSPADTTAAMDLILESCDEVVSAATAELAQWGRMTAGWGRVVAMLDLYRDRAERIRFMRANHLSY